MLHFFLGHVAMALDGDFVGAVEQESVTHDGDGSLANEDFLLDFEKIRLCAFYPQAARVVFEILEHGIELSPALQDAVVVTFFP